MFVCLGGVAGMSGLLSIALNMAKNDCAAEQLGGSPGKGKGKGLRSLDLIERAKKPGKGKGKPSEGKPGKGNGKETGKGKGKSKPSKPCPTYEKLMEWVHNKNQES